jgi:hypothetical protein
MNHIRRYRWLIPSAVVLIALAFTQPALAASNNDGSISLTTSPISLDLTIHPGGSVTKTLQLMNNGPQPVSIVMQLDTFSANGTSGQATIIPPSPNDPSLKWVTLSPVMFVAQPGVWTPVTLTITMPPTSELGYYYAVIFKPEIPDQPTTKANTIKGSNGIFVLVDTNSGNETRQMSISNFSVNHTVFEYLPATFSVGVRNDGNIHIAPYGNIYISRNSNMTHALAALAVNSSGGNVLPNSSRTFQASWSDGFPAYQPESIAGQIVRDKKGNPVEQLRWNFADADKFRFGKYYAQLTMVYNNGKQTVPITSTVSFWVIPWKALIAIGLIAVIVAVGVWSISRSAIKLAAKARRK